MIACVQLPCFATGPVEEAQILTKKVGKRERVVAMSPGAAGQGVIPGMALGRARSLCPEAQIEPAVFSRLQRQQADLLDLLSLFSDRLELFAELYPQTALVWVDLGKLRQADARVLAERILVTCERATAIRGSCGLGATKFMVEVAALIGVPGQVTVVPSGKEAAYLAPLPLARLRLERELARRLSLLGITTLGQFAALPGSAVFTQFGGQGRWLHRLAQGEDPRGIAVYKHPVRLCGARGWEDAVEDRFVLKASLYDLAEELAEALQGQGCRSVALVLQLADGTQEEVGQVLREPAYNRFTLAQPLTRLLAGKPFAQGVTGIEVHLSQIETLLPRQLDLFGHRQQDEGAIITQFSARYGPDRLCRLRFEPHAPLAEGRFQVEPVLA